jgi:hypothetical protein
LLQTNATIIAGVLIFLTVTSAEQPHQDKEKIQALSLAKDCYTLKLDLLTNATVVDGAIRFVPNNYKEKLKSLG